MLTLLAVDKQGTQFREDAFLVEDFSDPPLAPFKKRLTIASIVPARADKINADDFYANLTRAHGENFFQFLGKGVRADSVFHKENPREAVVVIYDISDDELGFRDTVENVAIDSAIVIPHSFEEFVAHASFEDIKRDVELFLKEHEHVWYKYMLQPHVSSWETINKAALLVSGILECFNRTLSCYARKKKMPTLVKNGIHLSFRVHPYAMFSSPARRAEGFVNLTNLLDILNGRPLTFTREKLLSLGVDI